MSSRLGRKTLGRKDSVSHGHQPIAMVNTDVQVENSIKQHIITALHDDIDSLLSSTLDLIHDEFFFQSFQSLWCKKQLSLIYAIGNISISTAEIVDHAHFRLQYHMRLSHKQKDGHFLWRAALSLMFALYYSQPVDATLPDAITTQYYTHSALFLGFSLQELRIIRMPISIDYTVLNVLPEWLDPLSKYFLSRLLKDNALRPVACSAFFTPQHNQTVFNLSDEIAQFLSSEILNNSSTLDYSNILGPSLSAPTSPRLSMGSSPIELEQQNPAINKNKARSLDSASIPAASIVPILESNREKYIREQIRRIDAIIESDTLTNPHLDLLMIRTDSLERQYSQSFQIFLQNHQNLRLDLPHLISHPPRDSQQAIRIVKNYKRQIVKSLPVESVEINSDGLNLMSLYQKKKKNQGTNVIPAHEYSHFGPLKTTQAFQTTNPSTVNIQNLRRPYTAPPAPSNYLYFMEKSTGTISHDEINSPHPHTYFADMPDLQFLDQKVDYSDHDSN